MKIKVLFFSLIFGISAHAQNDSVLICKIFDEALVNGQAHEDLRSLCKDVGARLSGSPEAEKAVKWGEDLLNTKGFDKVYLQKIEVPHWERGEFERATLLIGSDRVKLDICALGGSVSGDVVGEVIEVQGLKEMEELGKENINGKIIFFNRPMDPRLISTFRAYGGCVDQRYAGASTASKYGAIATITRSMSLHTDEHPHTGSMGYKDGVNKIPAAAISTKDADALSTYLKSDSPTKLHLELDCKTLPNKPSFNVIGEVTGSQFPDRIITIGGHLDSWDKGEGAHDDGAGIVHSIEALRLLLANNIRPKNTVRVVLFMNEENGNMGGRTYAAEAKRKSEQHLFAIESDRGGFSPRGFSIDGSVDEIELIQGWKELLKPYNLHKFQKGYAGVDIGPLKKSENPVNEDLLMLGLMPDSQRYFDYHHADTDVFENVNKRELELGCASIASMLYLLDKYYKLETN